MAAIMARSPLSAKASMLRTLFRRLFKLLFWFAIGSALLVLALRWICLLYTSPSPRD